MGISGASIARRYCDSNERQVMDMNIEVKVNGVKRIEPALIKRLCSICKSIWAIIPGGAKRLQDLQQYIHDNIDAVLKSQVPIWEFMKCLHVECGIDYPALTAYEKQFGPVDIYRGNRGER